MLYFYFISLFEDGIESHFPVYLRGIILNCRDSILFVTSDDVRNIFDRQWCQAVQGKLVDFQKWAWSSEEDKEAALGTLKRELCDVKYVENYHAMVAINNVYVKMELKSMRQSGI